MAPIAHNRSGLFFSALFVIEILRWDCPQAVLVQPRLVLPSFNTPGLFFWHYYEMMKPHQRPPVIVAGGVTPDLTYRRLGFPFCASLVILLERL